MLTEPGMERTGRPSARLAAAPDAAAEERAADLERGPFRRCLVTRAVRPKAELIRFVVSPEGEVTPDLAGRLPGRGYWIGAERGLVETAVKKHLFAKAAGGPARAPADLADRVARLLRVRALERLGLARRAGAAVAGHDKVEAWLRDGRAGLLLAAADGAADGRRRLAALAGPLPVVDCFTADELAAAFGRERVVHAAIAAGRLAAEFEAEAARLKGFRDKLERDESDGQ
jgi:predicted RNA-binding protein YlxR (DUF448 family)